MTQSPPIFRRPPPGVPAHPALWAMAGAMAAVQAAQSLALAGVLPRLFEPVWVFTFLAFFDVKFELARQTGYVDPQLLWSFLSYAFVHGGWVHLGLNAAIFLALGHQISLTVGIGRAVGIFAVTAVAGALVYALISDAQGPMVGASGAVFGYLGVVAAWRWREFRAFGLSTAPVLRLIAGLVAINVVLALGLAGLGGGLAWEAHLGGFVAGWLMAQTWRPRIRVPAEVA